MKSLFKIKCSLNLAIALGAIAMIRNDNGHSFKCYDLPDTHHACLETECGPYAWLWIIDNNHMFISKL